MQIRILCAIAAITILSTTPAQAALTYQTQSRRISVSGTLTVVATAPDFQPFNESVSTGGGGDLAGGGSVYQNSVLGASFISCDSMMTIFDGNQGSVGRGSSTLNVTFVLDATSPVELNGMWDLADINHLADRRGTATTRVRLSTSGSEVYYRSFSPNINTPDLETNLAFTGTLPAGEYRFEVYLTQEVYILPGFASGTSRLQVALSVPAPSGAMTLVGLVTWINRRRRR
jgi:hypothetical protein